MGSNIGNLCDPGAGDGFTVNPGLRLTILDVQNDSSRVSDRTSVAVLSSSTTRASSVRLCIPVLTTIWFMKAGEGCVRPGIEVCRFAQELRRYRGVSHDSCHAQQRRCLPHEIISVDHQHSIPLSTNDMRGTAESFLRNRIKVNLSFQLANQAGTPGLVLSQ
jgi:hypothetical protein